MHEDAERAVAELPRKSDLTKAPPPNHLQPSTIGSLVGFCELARFEKVVSATVVAGAPFNRRRGPPGLPCPERGAARSALARSDALTSVPRLSRARRSTERS